MGYFLVGAYIINFSLKLTDLKVIGTHDETEHVYRLSHLQYRRFGLMN